MFRLISSIAFALLAPAIAQSCDSEKESCNVAEAAMNAESADELTSDMRMSLLQGGLRGAPIESHDHSTTDNEKPETMSELQNRKEALLVELKNVDSELESIDTSSYRGNQGRPMVYGPSNMKCGADEHDFRRTFTLNHAQKGDYVTEQRCKENCERDSQCVAMSGQFTGNGAWCAGCRVDLWVPTTPLPASSFKKPPQPRMVPDRSADMKKCGADEHDFRRTFTLNHAQKGDVVTEQRCKENCERDSQCVSMSGQFTGNGAWCAGCKVKVWIPTTPLYAESYEKSY